MVRTSVCQADTTATSVASYQALPAAVPSKAASARRSSSLGGASPRSTTGGRVGGGRDPVAGMKPGIERAVGGGRADAAGALAGWRADTGGERERLPARAAGGRGGIRLLVIVAPWRQK